MSKALLIDFNHFVIACASVAYADKNIHTVNIDVIRRMTLHHLIDVRKKFYEYANVVICLDSKSSWRYDEFPYYKTRRNNRKKDDRMDWKLIHASIEIIANDFRDYFPWRVVKHENAEADDVIATLVKSGKFDDVLIISTDKDFFQLQSIPGVTQYDPKKKLQLKEDNPERFRFDLILKGDSGDDIPNIRMPDDTYALKVRSSPMTQKRLDECWEIKNPELFCSDEELPHYRRNEKLIDLVGDHLPKYIRDEIITIYEGIKRNKKSKLDEYMVETGINFFSDDIQFL